MLSSSTSMSSSRGPHETSTVLDRVTLERMSQGVPPSKVNDSAKGVGGADLCSTTCGSHEGKGCFLAPRPSLPHVTTLSSHVALPKSNGLGARPKENSLVIECDCWMVPSARREESTLMWNCRRPLCGVGGVWMGWDGMG